MKAIPDSDAGTRDALIRAGLDLFGRHGFEASSIRKIAQVAGVNSAGIAYHFGGMVGLRRDCAAAIVATMKQRIFGVGAAMPPLDGLAPEAAVELLLAIVGRVTAFAAQAPESETIARFVGREMMEPSAAFETLYEGLVGPVHGQVCRLWAAATGMEPEAKATKLAVFATIGQVIYFRLARPAVMRRMGWSAIDEAQSDAIAGVIRANVRASILSMREGRS